MSETNDFQQKHPLRFGLFSGIMLTSFSIWIALIIPFIGIPLFIIGIIITLIATLGKIGDLLIKASLIKPKNDFIRKMTTPIYKQDWFKEKFKRQ